MSLWKGMVVDLYPRTFEEIGDIVVASISTSHFLLVHVPYWIWIFTQCCTLPADRHLWQIQRKFPGVGTHTKSDRIVYTTCIIIENICIYMYLPSIIPYQIQSNQMILYMNYGLCPLFDFYLIIYLFIYFFFLGGGSSIPLLFCRNLIMKRHTIVCDCHLFAYSVLHPDVQIIM